jgi:DUF971 family protein
MVLPNLTSIINANTVLAVTNYRFKVDFNETTEIIETTSRGFYLKSLSVGGLYNTEYTISVATKHNEIWSEYGEECSVSTPMVPATKIQVSQCGIVLPNLTSIINANTVLAVTNYRFKVDFNETTEIIETTSRGFYLKSLSVGGLYNTEYTISVATKHNEIWSEYGEECTVSTPMVPATKVQVSQCGMVLPNLTSIINANTVLAVTNYRFKVDFNETTEIIETTSRGFYLKSLSVGGLYNTEYTISVATKHNGIWSEYGEECTITTPSNIASRITEESNKISTKEILAEKSVLIAYPSPFSTNFKLNFISPSDANIEVSVYDMVGRHIESRQVSSNEINHLELGNNYASGVYNLILKQAEEVKTVRVIKK